MQDQDIKDQVLQQIQELMMQLMGEKLKGGGAAKVEVEMSQDEMPEDASPLEVEMGGPEMKEGLEIGGEDPLESDDDEDDDLRRLEEMYGRLK